MGRVWPLLPWRGRGSASCGWVGRATGAPWCPQGSTRHRWPVTVPLPVASETGTFVFGFKYMSQVVFSFRCSRGHFFQLPCPASAWTRTSYSSSLAASEDDHDAISTCSKVKSQVALSLQTSFSLGSMIYQSSQPAANEA